jgi:hypothetical protein
MAFHLDKLPKEQIMKRLLRQLTLSTLTTIGLSILIAEIPASTQAQSGDYAFCYNTLSNLARRLPSTEESDSEDLDSYSYWEIYCLLVYGEFDEINDNYEYANEDLVDRLTAAIDDADDEQDSNAYDNYIDEEELEAEGLNEATLRQIAQSAVYQADLQSFNSSPNLQISFDKANEKIPQSSQYLEGHDRLAQASDSRARGYHAKRTAATQYAQTIKRNRN